MQLQRQTKRFAKAMVDAIAPELTKASPDEHRATNERITAALLADPEPVPRNVRKLSRDEQFVLKTFRSFGEVQGCIERLRDCETYIARYPYRGTRVTRAAYLQMVVELHLHELYILQQRLLTRLKQLQRAYRYDGRSTQVIQVTTDLAANVNATLGQLSMARGAHVHEERYDHADVARLRLIDLLSLSKDSDLRKAMRLPRRVAVQESHARLKQQAREWNSTISNLLERLFGRLSTVMLSTAGDSLRPPTPAK